jgi:hypothetical protein
MSIFMSGHKSYYGIRCRSYLIKKEDIIYLYVLFFIILSYNKDIDFAADAYRSL